MRKPTKEEVSITLSMIKYRLKIRGDNLEAFNPKYLEDKAIKLCEEWIRDYPDEAMFREVKNNPAPEER